MLFLGTKVTFLFLSSIDYLSCIFIFLLVYVADDRHHIIMAVAGAVLLTIASIVSVITNSYNLFIFLKKHNKTSLDTTILSIAYSQVVLTLLFPGTAIISFFSADLVNPGSLHCFALMGCQLFAVVWIHLTMIFIHRGNYSNFKYPLEPVNKYRKILTHGVIFCASAIYSTAAFLSSRSSDPQHCYLYSDLVSKYWTYVTLAFIITPTFIIILTLRTRVILMSRKHLIQIKQQTHIPGGPSTSHKYRTKRVLRICSTLSVIFVSWPLCITLYIVHLISPGTLSSYELALSLTTYQLMISTVTPCWCFLHFTSIRSYVIKSLKKTFHCEPSGFNQTLSIA